ncbi:MAG: azurin [Porticoccaceae bacterium]
MKKALSFVLATGALFFAGHTFAKTCELEISANDQLQFDKQELVVGADCEKVTLTLNHTGKLKVEQMGHNWVVASSADWQAVAQAGMQHGLENDYLPPDDERVIVHTDMIGGGESASITFDVSKFEKGGDYMFFCSFPGHWAVMKGKLVIQ